MTGYIIRERPQHHILPDETGDVDNKECTILADASKAKRRMEWQDSNLFSAKWGIIAVGALIGIFAALLQKLGNPGNMGIRVACFERDIADALGLHRAAVVQYMT